MTTPNPEQKIQREMQEDMLTRATPAQMARLLVDIMTAPPVTTGADTYDA